MARILAAVVVGFVLWSILWVGAAQVAMRISPESFDEHQSTTETGILVVFVVLSALFSIVAGFVVAKTTPLASMRTAWILACTLFVVGLVIEIAGWDKAPAWYHVVFLALLIPCVLIGATSAAGKRGA